MSYPEFDFAAIERWAYTTTLDEAFFRHEEEDPDGFEMVIAGACSLAVLFRFAADPACLKRRYFVQLLVARLCWIYGFNMTLPFHFSRFQGLIDKESYLEAVAKRAEEIYSCAEIIEQMRISADPALQALAKALLDYRNEWDEPTRRGQRELLKSINTDIVPLFGPSHYRE